MQLPATAGGDIQTTGGKVDTVFFGRGVPGLLHHLIVSPSSR